MEYFDKIIKWLYDNKEWIFSGIGLTGISFIGYFFKKKKSNTGNHMSSSFNIGSHITQVNGKQSL